MPDTGDIYISILILITLILTNAYFAMSEIAILSSNQNKMKKLSEGGDKRATQLLKITESSSSFLATIQVGVTLSGLLASAVAADKFSMMLANSINIPQINRSVIEGVSLVVITIVLSYFTLIFGELVPKRIAMKFPDKIALSVATPLTFLYKVLKPFVKFLAASTNGFLWLIGIKASKTDEEPVTQEDILMMIEQGEETGSIHGSELQMIQNIFELDDKIVSEVMSHRTEIAMISVDAGIDDVINLSREEGYSRIPVFEGDCDDIIGIVHIKDLIGKNDTLPLRSFLRKPIYVPEGKLCSKLLLEFQEKKTHMAIVIDEYGGTAGLVTLEDLIEIIVGSIQDESDNEPLEIEVVDENTYIFDGGISIEEVEKTLSIKLSDDYDCETIAGYVIAILGSFPDEIAQDAVSINDEYVAYVYELDDRRISRVKVIRDKSNNNK
ncbi:MAG: hemolysin family protein [Oscillospiraceae bacterium]